MKLYDIFCDDCGAWLGRVHHPHRALCDGEHIRTSEDAVWPDAEIHRVP